MSDQDQIMKEQAKVVIRSMSILEGDCRKAEAAIDALSPIGQDKPDHEAMWEELKGREDTSLSLRDVLEEIEARHIPCPKTWCRGKRM